MLDSLWSPIPERANASSMARYFSFLKEKAHLDFKNYNDLHAWSVKCAGDFWSSLFDFFSLKYSGSLVPAVNDLSFKSYGWFPQVELNFAENLLQKGIAGDTALLVMHETKATARISYADLKKDMACLQHWLKDFLQEGEVFAAYMPNIPETVVAMLATAGLGAVFTSTSCDFGVDGVIDRFEQTNPTVLMAATSYSYNGKIFSQVDKIKALANKLPSLKKIILVDFLQQGFSALAEELEEDERFVVYSDLLADTSHGHQPVFVPGPFARPLYIMYSSGTTGKPKCIVHSQGGTLLQHVKEIGLHTNMDEQKKMFFFTTCGWMMWNWLASALHFGGTVALYDGSPAYPSMQGFMQKIDEEKINIFGTSPKFLKALEDGRYDKNFKLESVETIVSTGAPLLPEQFEFVYEKIKKDCLLSSICGGTDIIGCFMLGNPMLPVYKGEIQCLGLGMDVAAYDPGGQSIFDREGELVCQKSFPSRPIYFLGDPDNHKINKAYFEHYKGVWHHGDFITITGHKTVRVYGRSDATLNPGGVRIGTAEIYRQTERLPYIADSLAVGRPKDGDVEVVLFVKLKAGEELTIPRIEEVKKSIKASTTPRHVPGAIYAITDIPYTRSGKKMELAVARIMADKAPDNLEAIANPECLEEYQKFKGRKT